jgi:uncharacterized membrane protein YoaK (UPF0700 family)
METQPPATADQKLVSLPISSALAATGGCLDAFTYVGHGHVFANSMTGNVVLLAVNAFGGEWRQSLRHLPPILTFWLGIACVRALGLPRFVPEHFQQARIVLTVEILCLFLLSWLPANASNFLVVTVVCFAASLQTATFRQVNQASYNTTFVTSNLRTLVESFFDWAFKGHRPADLSQAKDFAAICSAFFMGAVVGSLLTPRLQNRTLLLVVAELLTVLVRVNASKARFIAIWPRRPEESPVAPPASSSPEPPAHSGQYP